MQKLIKISKYGDLHTCGRKKARLEKRGCSHQCKCKWCQDNRLYKFKHQEPVDDYGHLYK